MNVSDEDDARKSIIELANRASDAARDLRETRVAFLASPADVDALTARQMRTEEALDYLCIAFSLLVAPAARGNL
ncbi:hypothetical protein BAQU_1703 [Bifidobacterium aquikefiri]|uniref:Uncharacterized protein n=1 Tax=Bifidobacterium aquikefiri TaxID=1653207 RepID=A0A261G279_9BIFI|nr:hypothetical protein BAQU_1703 [Bifidobacterium aquikefiri]